MHDRRDIKLTMVQMPALNTPQFDWCKTLLPRHPRPVPPVFQPEVAAEAIVWAAHSGRPEVYVGLSTLLTIWADKIIPGLLDRYLAHSVYKGQQMNEPVAPDRPDNLWQPVAGDYGARGRFNREAYGSSVQLGATQNRGRLALIGTAGATLIGAILLQKRRHST